MKTLPRFSRALLRRALLVSLATPLAASGASCGGHVAPVAENDGGETPDGETTHDGGTDPDAGSRPDAEANGCWTVGSPPDGGGACYYELPLYGNAASCGLTTGGPNPATLCERLCGQTHLVGCNLSAQNGQPSVQCTWCMEGRRPDGLLARDDFGDAREVGSFFAYAAYLEAASVEAFRILRDELAFHRAPRRLVCAAEAAAKDEIRHAKMMGALTRRFGGAPRAANVERRDLRSVEALAIENAVEGCVRETFGAIVAMWQAERAADPVVRAAMARVAKDEAGHASLAWAVARWAHGRLGKAARRRVAKARRDAVAALHAELRYEPSPSLVARAGMPPAAKARELAAALEASLWSCAA